MSNEWDDDEPIGYGKPPRYTRFRKGQSGNPKGRPKKRKLADDAAVMDQSDYDDMLRAELAKPIITQTPDGPKRITKGEAATMMHVGVALKGNALALRDVARERRELEERDRQRALAAQRAERERLEEQRRMYRNAVLFRDRRKKIWEEATSRGQEPDDPWPHHDDVLLFPAKQTFGIRGPIDEDGVLMFEYFRAERNRVFIEQYFEIDQWDEKPTGLRMIEVWHWRLYDSWLPLRWQLQPNRDHPLWHLRDPRHPKVRALYNENLERANQLRPLFTEPVDENKIRRRIGSLMRPLLKQCGYRSIAHLERAYEEEHGEPFWPRLQG